MIGEAGMLQVQSLIILHFELSLAQQMLAYLCQTHHPVTNRKNKQAKPSTLGMY